MNENLTGTRAILPVRNRLGKVISLILLVALLVSLFKTEGIARVAMGRLVTAGHEFYLSKFGWDRIRRGSLSIHGSSDSVELVAFIDYSCEYCAQSEEMIAAYMKVYPAANIAIHHVIPARTSSSGAAAIIAACADEHGILNKVHSALFYASATGDEYVLTVDSIPLPGSNLTPRENQVLGQCAKDPPSRVMSQIMQDSILTARMPIRLLPTFVGEFGRIEGVPDSVEDLQRIVRGSK